MAEPFDNDGRPAINGWVYFLGAVNGEDIKVGRSTGETMAKRLREVNADQTTNTEYRLLAALRGDPKDEKAVKRYFAANLRDDKGTRTEYFVPVAALAEYVNWLRQWWWVTIDTATSLDDLDAEAPDHWLPNPTRRLAPPPQDPAQLIQPHVDLAGSLAGTVFDWMISPKASVQDYFTPPELIDAARRSMGGIDLDAASHPIANRRHRIPDFFHISRSAFENRWYGKVWLNPPYGNNAPWFDRIVAFLDDGSIDQLCMLSPLWAFTAEQARPAMLRSAATVLLSPTPKFWGNANERTGTNHPHAVVYFGERIDEFVQAFAQHGIPLELAWNRMGAFSPTEAAA